MDDSVKDGLRGDAAIASATGSTVQVDPAVLRDLLSESDRLEQTRRAAAFAVALTDLASSAARLSERALRSADGSDVKAAIDAIDAWHAAGGK